MKTPEYSPVLVKTVEEALEPYKKILSPDMLEHFRQEALLQLSMHPPTARMIQKLTPPPVVQRSGNRPVKREQNEPAEPAPTRSKGSKKGGAIENE